jgi:hypothetical protein
MSKLIVIAAEMHKIAEITIDIKYRRPGNVIGYIPVQFEIFLDGEFYKAIPLQNYQTRLLTNLPNALLFQVKNGKICNCTRGTQEVIEELVKKLGTMNVVEYCNSELQMI